MASRLILGAVLLMQAAVLVSALDPYVIEYDVTTALFAECEEEINTIQGEPYTLKSENGRLATRFAPARSRSVRWDEIDMRDPKSLVRCFYYEERYYNNSTMLQFRSNRCYRTEDPAYSLSEEENCGDNPSNIVYILTSD